MSSLISRYNACKGNDGIKEINREKTSARKCCRMRVMNVLLVNVIIKKDKLLS